MKLKHFKPFMGDTDWKQLYKGAFIFTVIYFGIIGIALWIIPLADWLAKHL